MDFAFIAPSTSFLKRTTSTGRKSSPTTRKTTLLRQRRPNVSVSNISVAQIDASSSSPSHEVEPLLNQSVPTSSRELSCMPLSPPNDEADWVIVDILLEGENPPSYMKDENFQHQIGDDAKSLVRVLLRDASVEVSVVLCTDAHIRSLNSQWRGMDKATDVLSFPQSDPDGVVLGDIVISVETAFKQANERSINLVDELRILLVHGMLHLVGYDHEGDREGDWLIMAQMENRLLKQLEWNGEGLVAAVQDPVYRDIVQP